MTPIEQNVLGGAFAACALMLFCVAVPLYVLRHVGPGKPPPLPSGRVSIAGFGLVDVVGVTFFFGFYAFTWMAKRAAGDEAAGGGGGAAGGANGLDAVLLLSNLFLQGFFVLMVVGILCWRMNLVQAWGLRRQTFPWVVLWVPATVILVYGFNLMLLLAGYFEWTYDAAGKDAEKPSQEAVQLLQESNDPLTLGLMAITACFGAPLMEEIVFRGYLYAAVKRFSNIWVAVLFSGLLFGAVHLDLPSLLPLTFFGILLALLYEKTGSLWAPLAAHFIFNSLTVSIMLLLKVNPEWIENAEPAALFVGPW